MLTGKTITRRRAMGGIAALAGAGPFIIGSAARAAGPPVRMGITGATQTLWRYLAANKAELLEKPLGRAFEFKIFPADAGMRTTFLADDLEILTTIVPEAPALIERKIDVQFLFPIAWVKEAAVLVVTKASGITTIEQAKGRKIAAIPLTNAGGAVFRALVLNNHGIDVKQQMDLVETPFPEVPLESGQTEGGIILSRQWARLRESGKYIALANMGDEWLKASGAQRLLAYGGLIARRQWIAANNPVVDGLISGAVKAMEAYKADKAKFLEIARTYDADGAIKPQSPDEVAFNAWSLGMDDVPPGRVRLDRQDGADYAKLFGLLEKTGYLKAPPDVASLFYTG